ncbi:MAG: hypothetical protein ACK5XN_21135 [Bacteroidota bacterium]|jgi:hypothetical protein
MQATKNWWESKTLWVNVLTLLAMVISQVMGWDDMQQYAPQLLVISNVINMALRFLTTMPIK